MDMDVAARDVSGACAGKLTPPPRALCRGTRCVGRVRWLSPTGNSARPRWSPAVPRREDQNRHGLARTAPTLKDCLAVHSRQAHVQNNSVIWFGIAKVEPVLAMSREVHGIACFSQFLLQKIAKERVIFDNENSQIQSPPRIANRERPSPMPQMILSFSVRSHIMNT